jgi:hypothetical protein
MIAVDARLNGGRLVPPALETAGLTLLFLMLFVPTAYRPIKVALLAVLLMALALRILTERRVALHPHIAFGSLLFTVVGIVFVLRGYLADSPGAIRMSTVYIIWPCVNTLLITGLANEMRLWLVARLLVWATIAICLYCASFILWSAGWLPDGLYMSLNLGQRIGFYDGFMEFGTYSIASLLFLIPFVTAAWLIWPRRAPVARLWLWLALASGLVIGLLTGRRALQLVLVLGLPVALALRQVLPGRLRVRGPEFRRLLVGVGMAAAVALLTSQLAFTASPKAAWREFKTGFEFSVNPVAQSRASQFEALIRGWRSSPLLGSGHGAPASGVIRSATMPWAYELAYLALLYHTGIVGFVLYALGVVWIYVQGFLIIRQGGPLAPLMSATLTGTTTFLIANATNPYLEKFDCLWVLFLPIAFVNCSLLASRAAPPHLAQ